MLARELIRLTTLISLIIFTNCLGGSPLQIVKQWDLLSYDFPPDWPVNDKTLYNPEQIVATGFEIGDDKIFIANPRLFSGVPATISSVSRDSVGDSPVLKAFPDWSHHTAGLKQYNCSELGLVSVYRLKIDSCNRLWALDSGVSRSLEDFEITCPPKILVYDLNTERVVRRIDFPPEVLGNQTLFTNIIVDETTSRPENHCNDVHVYISDTVEPAIVVYDSGRDLTWRLSHPSMFADDNFAESRIGNDRFNLSDGVVGLSWDPESRVVYFQPLATDRLFSVSATALRAGPLPFGKELPVKLVGKKSSQGIGLGAAPTGGDIFFAPLTETAIAQYNPKTNQQRTLAFDYEQLQFVADFKTTSRDPTALYFVSSRFHKFFLKTVNPREINTRIIRISGVIPAPTTFTPSSFTGFDNNLYPFSHQPTPSYPVHPTSPPYQSPPVTPRPYHPFYNYVPQKSYFPTSPTYTSSFSGFQNPLRSYYSLRGPHSYSNFETFGVDARGYPFQQLNAGETLPQIRDYQRYNRNTRNNVKNVVRNH